MKYILLITLLFSNFAFSQITAFSAKQEAPIKFIKNLIRYGLQNSDELKQSLEQDKLYGNHEAAFRLELMDFLKKNTISLNLKPQIDIFDFIKKLEQIEAKRSFDPTITYLLGYLNYNAGPNVTIDSKKGLSLLFKASQNGHKEATFFIGDLHLSTKNKGKLSYEAYLNYMKQAADQGHVQASFLIGFDYQKKLYLNTQRGTKKPSVYKSYFLEAHSWFKQAADQGHVQAAQNLAKIKYIYDGGKLENLSEFLNLMKKNILTSGLKLSEKRTQIMLDTQKQDLQKERQLFIDNTTSFNLKQKFTDLIKSCQRLFKS